MSAKQKYLGSIHAKHAAGLKDLKIIVGNAFGVKEEEAYEELNRMHAAQDMADTEVLGKYSPGYASPIADSK